MELKNKCPTCGDKFSSEYGVKQHHAKSHGESISGVTVDCDNCGTTVRKQPSRVEKFDTHFCGDECRFEYKRGENHHDFQRIEVSCSNCGDSVEKHPRTIERGQDLYFCNYECRDEYYRNSNMFDGEKNPSWEGGYLGPYGRGWSEARNEIINLDVVCQSCESDENLVVHHIKPVRSFDTKEDAHYKENLVTLCRTCHPTFENLSAKEQSERLNVPRLEV